MNRALIAVFICGFVSSVSLAQKKSCQGRGNSGHDEAKHPEGHVTWDETYTQMQYMGSVFLNRQVHGGGSFYDIANSKQSNGRYQFEGYPRGDGDLNKLGSEGDARCEQARLAVKAVDYIKAHGPIRTDIYNWRGVLQPDRRGGSFVRVRNGAIRIAGTDFF
jgi:hypothetical protein